jgi:acetyl-CoA carboxylase, biotin carboxylase subunit
MFKRILIANRGEIALRIIHACRSLGIESVAVYSEADRHSPHLKHADHRICIGPAQSKNSYLNQQALLQAAIQMQCQAIHPGYGFLSENSLFATRCADQKLTFIGPAPQALRLMGDKVTARSTMAQFNVHGVPGSVGLVETVAEAQKIADEIGYPVLLKATAGGGGKGMRICRIPKDLPQAFEHASLEAQQSFGNAGLYLEKFVENGRHIEFQMLADRYGHVIHLGERECSTQRSNQKVIEEAPSPGVTPEQRNSLGAQLCQVLQAIRYEGAGTVEFLRAPDGALYFMEMNTRLQVEHPVTEMISGIDLVAWQIKIAAGQKLNIQQQDIQLQGHAIECRINAEDPLHNFRPAPGLIETVACPEEWRSPQAHPIRFDSHIQAQYRIPTQYDSMLGKLIVHASDRDSCIQHLSDALQKLSVQPLPTTIELHQYLITSQIFRSGQYSTPTMAHVMQTFSQQNTNHDPVNRSQTERNDHHG